MLLILGVRRPALHASKDSSRAMRKADSHAAITVELQ